MYRSHFRLHPKPVLIAHRLSCIDRTIPIDQLLLVAGLQDPSVTSTLIQQNREGLDSGEQNIDLQLHPEALLSRWVGEIHPPTPAPITKSPHPPISLLHSAHWTMHQYRVLLTMCCSLTANESRLVRGTTQNSSSREPPITYSCLRYKATITTHWCKSSASTAGLLIYKYKDLHQYLTTTACFCRLLCSVLVFTPLKPHAAPAHTPFHQLHSCQTVINESNRGARQPRSPSCLGRTGDGQHRPLL